MLSMSPVLQLLCFILSLPAVEPREQEPQLPEFVLLHLRQRGGGRAREILGRENVLFQREPRIEDGGPAELRPVPLSRVRPPQHEGALGVVKVLERLQAEDPRKGVGRLGERG